MAFVDRDGVHRGVELRDDYATGAMLSWAAGSPRRWRDLWLLQLRDTRGWSYSRIAECVGLHRSSVSRRIRKVRKKVAALLNPPSPEAMAS
ncbi:hypothetical protein VT03_21170 [Planctomyces sp. SH-PL14]|nr:hypothetical protein VT03_21170 [Planctomyces sp. SH-PL14]